MVIKQALIRIHAKDIESTIDFYEKLYGKKCELRFSYLEVGLELAQIENILIISGPEKALVPFRDTKVTFLVDSIIEYRDFLLEHEAIIIKDIKECLLVQI
jgi:hypothetical protein